MLKTFFFLLFSGLTLLESTNRATQGDPSKGKKIFESRCAACHSLTTNGVGPALRGVVGRKAGLYPGYEFSKALKESKIVWTDGNLQRYLANPGGFIQGQKMFFKLPLKQDRDHVIAYLGSR